MVKEFLLRETDAGQGFRGSLLSPLVGACGGSAVCLRLHLCLWLATSLCLWLSHTQLQVDHLLLAASTT